MSNLAGLGFRNVAIVIIIFLRCVGQTVRARWRYLARLELSAVSRKNAVFFMPINKTFIYRRWLNVGFVPFLRAFYGTRQRLVQKASKTNSAINIQPP